MGRDQPRMGRHHQYLRLLRGGVALEMEQRAEGLLEGLLLHDCDLLPLDERLAELLPVPSSTAARIA